MNKFIRFQNKRKGFTLIELLVVLLISMILIGLVMYPVTQSFILTRRAQAMADAQDSARVAMEKISREIAQAMSVFDNSVNPILLPVRSQDGTTITYYEMPSAKLDIIMPKALLYTQEDLGAGTPKYYERGKSALPPHPEGTDDQFIQERPILPIQQDQVVVRYFLGLRYNNPNDSRFGWRPSWGRLSVPDEENQVVLYRIELDPYDKDIFPDNMNAQDRIKLFAAILDDPKFFYKSGDYDGLTPASGEEFYEVWARKADAVGMGQYQDLVEVVLDSNEDVLQIQPSVSFRLTSVVTDNLAGVDYQHGASGYPSDVPMSYRAKYGYWSQGYKPTDEPFIPGYKVTVIRDQYDTAYTSDHEFDNNGNLIFRIIKWERNGNSWSKVQTYNITDYLNGSNDINLNPEMAFTVDVISGTVNFALNPPFSNTSLGLINYIDEAGIDAINYRFYQVHDGLDGFVADRGSARRYVDLITVPPTAPNCPRIVPGSEVVIGPNMIKGQNFGMPVKYQRSAQNLGYAGLNEYTIDYFNGIVYFSSRYGDDIPSTAPLRFNYKIHFNGKNDVVRADYKTKSMIEIRLGMRVVDETKFGSRIIGDTSYRLHTVELNNTVNVRNMLR